MASEKPRFAWSFRSPCTNFSSPTKTEIRRRLGKTQNKFWFFARLALILQPRKQLDGLSLASKRSMRKVRATESIPLVNVQGVGDGRGDAEENNRPAQAR